MLSGLYLGCWLWHLWPRVLKFVSQFRAGRHSLNIDRRTLQRVGTLGRGLGSAGRAREVFDAGLQACAPVYSVLLFGMTALTPALLPPACTLYF